MSCQCYEIGGPFIAEDPDCLLHNNRAEMLRADGMDGDVDTPTVSLRDVRYRERQAYMLGRSDGKTSSGFDLNSRYPLPD